jgi:hypothetical protein
VADTAPKVTPVRVRRASPAGKRRTARLKNHDLAHFAIEKETPFLIRLLRLRKVTPDQAPGF